MKTFLKALKTLLIVAVEEIVRVVPSLSEPELEVAGFEAPRVLVHEAGQEAADVLLHEAVNLVALLLHQLRVHQLE